jgi:hypothetical protein
VKQKALERLVVAWKAVHIVVKPLVAKLDAARDAVTQAIIDSQLDHIVTKLGTIALQTRTTTDWEGLARSLITESMIESSLHLFQKQSKPFISAPRDWSSEAKQPKTAKAA